MREPQGAYCWPFN